MTKYGYKVFVGLIALFLIGCQDDQESNLVGEMLTPWRGAYMNTFATNGEIINSLKRTNIPQLVDADFSDWETFPFAPPINELAIAGEIDIVPEGVIPVASLLAADPENWIIAGRLIYFPIVLVARNGTGITTLDDLSGKVIGTPFGSGAHPPVYEALESAGLTGDDVSVVNLGIPEQVEAMRAAQVDVVGTWEPQVAVIEGEGLGYKIAEFQHTAYILLRKSKAEADRQETVNILKGFLLANYFASVNREKVTAWFAQDSRYDRELLDAMLVTEPNMSRTSLMEIELDVTSSDLQQGTEYSEFMVDLGLLPARVDFEQYADFSYLVEAKEQLNSTPNIEYLIQESM